MRNSTRRKLKPVKQANINYKLAYRLRDKRLKELGYESYRAYLASDHWRDLRRKYRRSRRHRHSCFVCANSRYELHHRSYINIGEESLDDLIPLCRNCHSAVHEFLKKFSLDVSLYNGVRRYRAYKRNGELMKTTRLPSLPTHVARRLAQ